MNKKVSSKKSKTKRSSAMGDSERKKNPLYVVTEKGKTVQEAKSVCDMIIKKLNLTPMIEMLKTLFQFLTEQLKGYTQVTELLKVVQETVTQVRVLLLTYFPFVKI